MATYDNIYLVRNNGSRFCRNVLLNMPIRILVFWHTILGDVFVSVCDITSIIGIALMERQSERAVWQ